MVKLHISSDWDIYLRKEILILGSQTLSAGELTCRQIACHFSSDFGNEHVAGEQG